MSPASTRQAAEVAEAALRLDPPPPDPDRELEQARAMALAAQARWNDTRLLEAIQPRTPEPAQPAQREAAPPEPSLASEAATRPAAEPRLMMTA